MTPGSNSSQGRQLAALSAPAVVFTVAMIAFPIAYTIWLGFHSFSNSGASTFTGVANYAKLAGDGEFWNGLYVTFALYVLSMVLQLVFGVYLAMLLFHSRRLSGLLRSLLISPFMMPPVVAGMMWLVILDPSLGAVDEAATVHGESDDLHVDLIVVTSIPGGVFKHRMRLLAGNQWELRDVSAA